MFTGGVKLVGDVQTVETRKIIISHNLDNSKARNFQSYKRRFSDCSLCLCGISKQTPRQRDDE